MKFMVIDFEDTCVLWKKYKTFCSAEILRLCTANKFNKHKISIYTHKQWVIQRNVTTYP